MAIKKIVMTQKAADGTDIEQIPATTLEQIVDILYGAHIVVDAPGGATIYAQSGSIKVSAKYKDGLYEIIAANFGVWTIHASLGDKIEEKSVNVTKASVYKISMLSLIYGAQWDGTSNPAWTRTDAAADFADPVPYIAGMAASDCFSPFDNIYPWRDMKVVENPLAGTVVSIPKFYYKWTFVDNAMKLQICSEKTDGFFTSPAHMDRGDGNGERDVVYVGRYKCNDGYVSTTGVLPLVSKSISNFRTNIHNLGDVVWQNDYAMRVTIWMLYLVEFANWNSQAVIGYGCGNGSSIQETGYTDSMPYHTGTTQSSRTTYGLGTQYRYIEGLWDNVVEFVDGVLFNEANMIIEINPNNFSTISTTGTTIGQTATSTGYIASFRNSSVDNFDWVIYPFSTGASSTTYVCDQLNYAGGVRHLHTGGYYAKSALYGMFFLNRYYSTSTALNRLGSRLMILP